MRLLFCEGSSLSARETLTALGPSGHKIFICDPNPLNICRFSQYHVKYYKCPSINEGIETYFDRIVEIIKKEKIDVLVPVHEHAFLFSKRINELKKIVNIELPDFNSYIKLFSKIYFIKLLEKLAIPYPKTLFCRNKMEIRNKIFYPCFIKKDYGTASAGVWNIRNENDLDDLFKKTTDDGNEFLIQEYASGKFEIAYSLFYYGQLVSFHACQRIKEGSKGSSSIKIGVDREIVRNHFILL
jgi:carbamoylphosphate synthase large subunit